MDFFKRLRKSAKDQAELKSQLALFVGDMEISKKLKKATSLRELGRQDEANVTFQEALTYARNLQSHAPSALDPRILEALVFLEWERNTEAERCLATLLSTFGGELDDARLSILQGTLQDLRRRSSIAAPGQDGESEQFTQIYVCRECGRLVNYITKRCPACSHVAQNVEDMAASYVLSTPGLSVAALIDISRRRKIGQPLEGIIGNFHAECKKVLSATHVREQIQKLVKLCLDNLSRNEITLDAVRCCDECGSDLLSSCSTTCPSCEKTVRIADMRRLCIAVDNILVHIEDRAAQKISGEYGQLVCFLVWLRTHIIEKQQGCDATTAKHVLELLRTIGYLADKGGGGVIDLKDDLKIHLFRDRMGNDTEAVVTLLWADVRCLVEHLRQVA